MNLKKISEQEYRWFEGDGIELSEEKKELLKGCIDTRTVTSCNYCILRGQPEYCRPTISGEAPCVGWRRPIKGVSEEYFIENSPTVQEYKDQKRRRQGHKKLI